MSRTQQIHRYLHTLRHLRPWQVAGRVVSRVKSKAGLTRLPDVPDDLRIAWQTKTSFPQHDPWNTVEELRAGRFCFLNEARDLGREPVDWQAADAPLLWRFNLHYFHYLHLLPADEQVALCRDWIADNSPGTAVSWHAYPTSLRIVNWCRAGLDASDVLASLYQQAAHLYRNLETYIYGNHLLENARALVVAGAFFGEQGEAPQWLAKGLALYRAETFEQILPDGSHYERSPMYHALMLAGYLDVLNVIPASHPDRPRLEATAQQMLDALATMTHPDDQLALFNDSTHDIALAPADVRAYADRLLGHTPVPPATLPETGYFTHRDDDLYLIVDGGPVGPRHLMAHAHADIFSYELSVHGLPFIVDSGVFEYPAGEMRDYVRSTRAHNTVTIDGIDQVECWGSFRVARREAPQKVRFTQDDLQSSFEGTFAGYAQFLGDNLRHHRSIEVDKEARTVTVDDVIEGKGTHTVESRIHLHPDVTCEQSEGSIVLRCGDVVCQLNVLHGEPTLETSWYCPRFGVRHERTCITLRATTPLPARLTYGLEY